MQTSGLISKAALLLALCLVTWTEPRAASADPILTILHHFKISNGVNPYGALIFDESGALYGTTIGGGAYGYGAVYKLSPPNAKGGAWTETVLHSFAGVHHQPTAGLIFDKSGALYGTTQLGGTNNHGTVFKLTPPVRAGGWTEKVLYSFTGKDGAYPAAGLISDESGALYGTSAGGADNHGTVFKLTPSARTGDAFTENVLHSFKGPDGDAPFGSLIFDKSGALYGTTMSGGDHNLGTIFKLTRRLDGAWTARVLHSFTGNQGGSLPSGALIFDEWGALYGSTQFGGTYNHGTVFKLTPPGTKGGAWAERVLHSFTGKDGAQPNGDLIVDKFGAIYGTTIAGGAYGYGAVYKLMPPSGGGLGTETPLHSFTGTDGSYPMGGVIFDKSGELYGTTSEGFRGASGNGTVFKLRFRAGEDNDAGEARQ